MARKNIKRLGKNLNKMNDKNILLANFLGLEKQEDNTYFDYESCEYINPEDLIYNESWDMLMLVVTKIESLNESNIVNISTNATHIQAYDKTLRYMRTALGKGESKKEAVYNACVEFVEWWNKNN